MVWQPRQKAPMSNEGGREWPWLWQNRCHWWTGQEPSPWHGENTYLVRVGLGKNGSRMMGASKVRQYFWGVLLWREAEKWGDSRSRHRIKGGAFLKVEEPRICLYTYENDPEKKERLKLQERGKRIAGVMSLRQTESQSTGEITGLIKEQGYFHYMKKADRQSTWEQGSQSVIWRLEKWSSFHLVTSIFLQ